jgi:hypothetical protein
MRTLIQKQNKDPFAAYLTFEGYSHKQIYLAGIYLCEIDQIWNQAQTVCDYYVIWSGERVFAGHSWDSCGEVILNLLHEGSFTLVRSGQASGKESAAQL